MEQVSNDIAHYETNSHDQEMSAGVHIAFMLGQWLKEPGNLIDLQIAEKQRELQDVLDAGGSESMICLLSVELKQLRLIRIEAVGVHENAHARIA